MKSYACAEQLTREMCLDLIEYITIDEFPGSRKLPRNIHIYYKLLDKSIQDRTNLFSEKNGIKPSSDD